MTTPGVRVACDALRSDATAWADAADLFETAVQATGGLTLGLDKLGFAAQQRGLTAAYQSVQLAVSRVLKGGAVEFDKLAVTLKQAADTYQREDWENARRIAKARKAR